MIQKSFKNKKGKLYLVATPIGNLDEMTMRSIKVLSSVDFIAAEDTRRAKILTNYFSIQTPIFAYHEYNEDSQIERVIGYLEEGKTIALVSDAGYPLISDPGFPLVRSVVKEGFDVIPISGSSAFLNALVASGIEPYPFLFGGFLESKQHSLMKQLEEVKNYPFTLIYYVSVHKVEKSLKIIYDVLGDRKICLARELTKKHEEFIRGNIQDILNLEMILKGEYVLVIERAPKSESNIDDAIDEVESLVNKGFKTSKAISITAKHLNISKNKLYELYHLGKGRE